MDNKEAREISDEKVPTYYQVREATRQHIMLLLDRAQKTKSDRTLHRLSVIIARLIEAVGY